MNPNWVKEARMVNEAWEQVKQQVGSPVELPPSAPKTHDGKMREICRKHAIGALTQQSDVMIKQVVGEIENEELVLNAKGTAYKGKWTIHNWIKDLFPAKSRAPGRRKNRN